MSDVVSTLVGIVVMDDMPFPSGRVAHLSLVGERTETIPFLRLVGDWSPDEFSDESTLDFPPPASPQRTSAAVRDRSNVRPPRPTAKLEARLDRLVDDLDRESASLLKKIEAAIDAARGEL